MAAAMMPGTLDYNTSGQPQPMQQPPPFVPPQPQTPYGSFVPPDVNQLSSDPTYKYDLGQQQQAIQRSAAARGTLLTPGLLMKLQENASGVAGQHYGDIFGRSLAGYNAGRDTFNANNNATLGFANLGLNASNAAYGHARDAFHDQQDATSAQDANAAAVTGGQHQTLLDTYAQSQAAQRAAALAPRPTPTPFQRGGFSPGPMRRAY